MQSLNKSNSDNPALTEDPSTLVSSDKSFVTPVSANTQENLNQLNDDVKLIVSSLIQKIELLGSDATANTETWVAYGYGPRK